MRNSGRINIPLVIIYQLITRQLPDSPLVVYPGLDYSINVIHPERCTQQVREFVASRTLF